jgi:hypothetical protein
VRNAQKIFEVLGETLGRAIVNPVSDTDSFDGEWEDVQARLTGASGI